LSDRTEIESPLFYNKNKNKIRKASKRLSRKKKNSNHYKKANRNLAKVHKFVADSRKDYFFKLAKNLTEKYDYIFLEDLNLKGMKKLWGKKISDLSFATFVNILEFQATKNGCTVYKIDRFFPSSKTCFHCKTINKDLELKDRTWICPNCGIEVQRDFNAALNIHREGASSLNLDTVRLTKVS